MMESPREFIEGIARSKGLFTESFRQQAEEEARDGRRGMLQAIQSADEIRKDHSGMLNIISTDLYTSRARFLMEVIQNADDNRYLVSSTPTLCISVSSQLVKIECNEIGFTEENVQALCRTGQSSKPPGQGYIGEKGIGFKSVFKIAKRAHVRSPPYYFQLDKDRMLGMITPEWDDEYFAVHPQEYQTTIILDRICDASTDFSTALQLDIEAFNPMVILFLRRLVRLQMTLSPPTSSQNGATMSRCFRRYTDTLYPEITTLENEDSGSKVHFYKRRHVLSFNGTEVRRPNLSRTEIVLAFPVELVSDTWIPKPKQLPTFAYLPLGNFGFKFIIQADFLTTSNRQSVDEDSSWNIKIARAIPQAFVNAVHIFNRQSRGLAQLAKTWPLFLKGTPDTPSQYWLNIREDILELLREHNLIQTRSGSYASPPSLMFLSWAHDRDEKPMFGTDDDYVSSAYPDSVRTVLRLHLGVRTPDSWWISRKLGDLHRSGSLHGRNRSLVWYSDLAKVILTPSEYECHSTYISELCELPLIPLSNGRWSIAPTLSNPIYFPQSLETRIPSGLPLTLVEEEACESIHRMELFELLGVQHCDISNIVGEIVGYHTRLTTANSSDIIGHAKYLYYARNYLEEGDMKEIYFDVLNERSFQKGSCLYADCSSSNELIELFSGYRDAHFLNPSYFQDFNAMEKRSFIDWLKSAADVATIPRLKTWTGSLHADFLWLLASRNDRVLSILRRHWNIYNFQVTSQIKRQLADRSFPCQTENLVPLCQSFIPLPHLVENCRELCGSNSCSFLVLSDGLPSDWTFLSLFDVGTEDNLDFYLWILEQPGFKTNPSVERAKRLYSEIQLRAGSNPEKVRNAFRKNVIALLDGTFVSASNCVYHAPQGFRAKPSLFAIYGDGLSNLFQNVLDIRIASSTEALAYLQQLRSNSSTTMQTVSSVYEYLQYYFQRCAIDPGSHVIAIPSALGSLEWKTPSECVWDDSEFSQNELQLRSKIAMRQIIEQHAPIAILFFTTIIKLQNAGIDELLSDLELLQRDGSDDSATIFRLYERIETYHRSSPAKIKRAFQTKPLVFLRGHNGNRGQWLTLELCIWGRTILRTKHALMPTLHQYRSLFRDTLGVPNVTLEMLVLGLLLAALGNSNAPSEGNITYCKDLMLDISRKRETNNELRPLRNAQCWPCRLPSGEAKLCAVGDFYVNDRQNLFDVFRTSQTFLDLDFDDSRKVIDLLRQLGCVSFLSEQVTMDTEPHLPLQIHDELTQNYQRRADALDKYFEHHECRSPYDSASLLESVRVWISPNIETHYHIPANGLTSRRFTVTRVEGGSCVRVDTELSLNVYFSSDQSKRDCALVTDFPRQLVEALQIRPANVATELHQYLEVPLGSLNMLLIRKGIIGEIPSLSADLEISESDEMSEDEQTHHEDSLQSSEAATSLTSPERRSSVTPLAAPVAELSIPSVAVTEQAVASSRSLSNRNFISRLSAVESPFHNPSAPSSLPTHEEAEEVSLSGLVTAEGIYSTSNRSRNTDRLWRFAQRSSIGPNASTNGTSNASNTPNAASFDMRQLESALLDVQTPVAPSVQTYVRRASWQRARVVPDRNQDERARDFEIGFLGEHYIFTVLRDRLRLPDFSGEVNWTSSLRSRAGFSTCADVSSDFKYLDKDGALTRYLQQMQFPYTRPAWLDTVLGDGNRPTYLLEVKSTPYQDPTTRFFMSGGQHALAKSLQVSSTRPTQIYAIVRVSGLDALEDSASHEPQWRVYLDPYSLGEGHILDFYVPTYTVTAIR
ncbi:hypothetical protein B7463_g12390, partial [Scytalidium lignicola]